jgi:transcription initiation factor TFIID subunit 1, fungi type
VLTPSIFALGVQINGEWQTEIIRDPAVIRAYVRGRHLLEEEATLADSLAPTGDADKDKRAKKRQVFCPFLHSLR